VYGVYMFIMEVFDEPSRVKRLRVWSIKIYGLRVTREISNQTDLPRLIVEEAENQAHG